MRLSPGIFLKMILLIAAVMVTACAPTKRSSLESTSTAGVAQIYECRADYEFLVRIEGEIAHLFLPDRTVSLIHQPAGSGTKYSRGDVVFWSWDDEAMLEIGPDTRMTCTLNPKRDSLK